MKTATALGLAAAIGIAGILTTRVGYNAGLIIGSDPLATALQVAALWMASRGRDAAARRWPALAGLCCAAACFGSTR